jgi:DNA-binding HxlR family transcriptional regulator
MKDKITYLHLHKVTSIQKVSSYLFVSNTIFLTMVTWKEKKSEADCKARLNSIADALYVIGGKWKLRIIVALKDGDKRFNELQRLIGGISAKVLSAELKDLELNGVVRRNVIIGPPVSVEYVLTDYSDSLGEVLYALSKWGALHRERVRKSMSKKR